MKTTCDICRGFLLAFLVVITTGLPVQGADAAESLIPAGMKLVKPDFNAEIPNLTRELNQRLSQGVEPAENAVVHIVQLVGESVFPDGLRTTSLKMLGIESLDKDLPRFVYFGEFALSKSADDKQVLENILEDLSLEFHTASTRPWKPDDFPLLTEYFARNKEQLDRLTKIADLPSYFAPILSEEIPPSLFGASFAIEHRLPFLSQCLSIRALSYVPEQFDKAKTDLLAAHKLAYLLSKGSPLDISMAKAHRVDSFPFRSELEILSQTRLTTRQLSDYLNALRLLPVLPGAATAAELGERYTLRQEIELLRDNDTALYEFFDWDPAQHAGELSKLRIAKINWDVAFKRADELQNETVATMLLTDREQQQKEIVQQIENANKWKSFSEADQSTLAEKLLKDKDEASRWIGEAVAHALQTNVWQRINTDRRGLVRREFAIIGFAIATYRSRHDAYPQKLSDLSPEILPVVPNEAHSNQPFGYEHLPNGQVRLISLGADRISNTGQWPSDDIYLDLK